MTSYAFVAGRRPSAAVRVTAWLNLVGNLVIIATGGAVRLTGSGLGCSTWPQCTEESWVPTTDEGLHGVIEFANRLMSPVLVVLAVLALIVTWRSRAARRDLWVHAWLIMGGVLLQAVIGGVVVLTRLEMSTVGVHYFVSAVLVGVASSFVVRSSTVPGPRQPAVPRWLAIVTHVSTLLLAVVVVVGIITTQHGPHSGDEEVLRNQAAWETLTHVHAWFAYALVAALVVMLIGGALARAARYVAWVVGLLALIGVQIVVGIAQARLGIPPLLVGVHMVLAGGTVAVMVPIVAALKRPAAVSDPVDG